MLEKIQWDRLSKLLELQVGAGGEGYAKQALELIIGEENLKQAVDCYINGEPGSNLARSMLILIQPWVAMCYCHEVYLSTTDQNKKRWAVELLSDISDSRALQWFTELLEDEDEVVQKWGVKMLDRMAYARMISDEELNAFLEIIETSTNMDMKIRAQAIRKYYYDS